MQWSAPECGSIEKIQYADYAQAEHDITLADDHTCGKCGFFSRQISTEKRRTRLDHAKRLEARAYWISCVLFLGGVAIDFYMMLSTGSVSGEDIYPFCQEVLLIFIVPIILGFIIRKLCKRKSEALRAPFRGNLVKEFEDEKRDAQEQKQKDEAEAEAVFSEIKIEMV